MKVEGRGQACPSVTGLGVRSRSFPGGPPFITSLISLAEGWFQGSSAETVGGSREHSVPFSLPLSQPVCPPVPLLQEQAWASPGPYCLSLLGPLGLLPTPETPEDNASLEQGDVRNSNSVSEAPGPWGLGCRRLAQLSWSSLCFIVCQPSPAVGPQGQRVTCSEPAAPA